MLEKPERVLLYELKLWKGVLSVYVCSSCGFSTEIEDDMKLHVLAHFPEDQRDAVLDMLVNMEGGVG